MIIHSASELGGCSKYLIAKRLGFDPPPNFGADVSIFQRGHRIEQEVLTDLRAQGWTITETQPELYIAAGKTADDEPIMIRCHPDAIGTMPVPGTPDAREVAIEIKSADATSYSDLTRNGIEGAGGLFPRYRTQISCYMVATGLPVAFIVRQATSGETYTRVIETPFVSRAELLQRVTDLEAEAEAYNIPRECDYPNRLCPLYYLHEDARQQAAFKLDADLDELAREYERLRLEEKERRQKMTTTRLAIRAKILTRMGLDPKATDGITTTVDTGNVKAVAVWSQTSFTTYDVNAMREDGFPVEKYKKNPTVGWKLRVYVRGKKVEG